MLEKYNLEEGTVAQLGKELARTKVRSLGDHMTHETYHFTHFDFGQLAILLLFKSG